MTNEYHVDYSLDGDSADTLNIDGTITSNVSLGGGDDVLNLASTGSIGGYINFGYGVENFTYNSSVGTVGGYIAMGGGDDTLTIAKNFAPTTLSTGYAVL